jgi:hypothetical protein
MSLEKVMDALGWKGGTIHQVIDEIKRLKRVEEKARYRFENPVEGEYSTFCAFCFSDIGRGVGHSYSCIVHDMRDKDGNVYR